MDLTPPHVLDVGQCDFDHGTIRQTLVEEFGASVDRAGRADEALAAARSGRYDLVLVNRLFDADQYQGLDFIRRFKAEPALAATPIMLISNYAEAQANAVNLGATPGFGKSALDDPSTHHLLAQQLGRRAAGEPPKR